MQLGYLSLTSVCVVMPRDSKFLADPNFVHRPAIQLDLDLINGSSELSQRLNDGLPDQFSSFIKGMTQLNNRFDSEVIGVPSVYNINPVLYYTPWQLSR